MPPGGAPPGRPWLLAEAEDPSDPPDMPPPTVPVVPPLAATPEGLDDVVELVRSVDWAIGLVAAVPDEFDAAQTNVPVDQSQPGVLQSEPPRDADPPGPASPAWGSTPRCSMAGPAPSQPGVPPSWPEIQAIPIVGPDDIETDSA